MSVINHKIWRDLWHNKGRTFQIVLIIAMGAFAIGMIIGSSDLMRERMTGIWLVSSPAMINLGVEPAIDDNILESLKNIQGVVEVEGYIERSVEWRLTPAEAWKPAGLIARDDYEAQTFAKLNLVSGNWPKEKVFAVEQGAGAAFGLREGGQVYIRVDDREYTVKIGGTISNPTARPLVMGGNLQFYATRDRLGQLTGARDFNRIAASAEVFEEVAVTELADRMDRHLEKLDIEASGAEPGRISDPDEHYFQDLLNAVFLLMGIMAALALMLGLFLVYNTVNALIAQQISQIGMMKAIGARTRQILRIYLSFVFIHGLLALWIAVPLGALGAYQLNLFITGAFNIAPDTFTISWPAVLAQVAICLLSPLLAALIPVFSGARVTVREALSTYGLNTSTGRLGRWLATLPGITWLLIISNAFRNKGRVILTQLTLVSSGLIFMMIMSVGDSVNYMFGDLLFSILRYDVTLSFEDNERIQQIEAITLAQPEVKAAEMWGLADGTLRRAGRPESNDDAQVTFFGVPISTTLYGPQLRAGRWLEPGDSYAAVLNQKLAKDAGVTVGDWIILTQKLYGDSKWLVVGLVSDPIFTNAAHAPRETVLREMHSVGKARTVWIQTWQNDAASQLRVANRLRQVYEAYDLDVSPQNAFPDTAAELTRLILDQFKIIAGLLAVMAMIIGIVGGFALSGVLSLSVLERRREIGVMRAIGASSLRVAGLFIGEGLFLGWLSWLIALLLSIPAGYFVAQALGAALDSEIVYKYSPTGALYWLGLVIVLSIAASWLPARSATRISVRESLAYQ